MLVIFWFSFFVFKSFWWLAGGLSFFSGGLFETMYVAACGDKVSWNGDVIDRSTSEIEVDFLILFLFLTIDLHSISRLRLMRYYSAHFST